MKNTIYYMLIISGYTMASMWAMGTFEPLPSVNDEQLREKLRLLEGKMEAKDGPIDRAQFQELLTLTAEGLAEGREIRNTLSKRLQASYLFVTVYTTVAAAFVLVLVIFFRNRRNFRITFADNLSILCLLDSTMAEVVEKGNLEKVRGQLGMLRWYINQALLLINSLIQLSTPSKKAPILGIQYVLEQILSRLIEAKVKTVNPWESKLADLSHKVDQAKQAERTLLTVQSEITSLKQEAKTLSDNIAKLKEESIDMGKLDGLQRELQAAIKQQAVAAQDQQQRETKLLLAESRLQAQLTHFEALKVEVISLLSQLAAWDETKNGLVTHLLSTNGSAQPILSEMVGSWQAKSVLRKGRSKV